MIKLGKDARTSSFVTILMLTALLSHAQQKDSLPEDLGDKKRFIILPAAFYSPETSLGFGVAAIVYFRPKDASYSLRPSNTQSVLIFTLEKQMLFTTPYDFFIDKENYWLTGQIEYNIYPYEFYGIGSDISMDDFESYSANFLHFEFSALKKIGEGFYLGPTIFLDQYFKIKADPEGKLRSNNTLGVEANGLLGVGATFRLDKRNNIFSPVGGYYIESQFLQYENKLFGAYSFSDFSVDFRKYFHPWNELETGVQLFHQTIFGDPPFYNYALMGGGKLMRGYYKGAYRDNHQTVLQGEVRKYIFKRIILSAFGGFGSVAESFMKYDKLLGSYGIGVRYELDPDEHLRIRLDYARGLNTDGIYININEAF